ncbi:MAG: cupin domain-containing protein [Desulfovibrionales bacterium]|nr:cupin domain-containing protein [Desulfovibrionales bacterium]
MHKSCILESRVFNPDRMDVQVVYESEHVKVINFNLKAGQDLPVHSHNLDGELVLVVLSGEGDLLGANGPVTPLKVGDVLTCGIKTPHGVHAEKDMSLIVTIAPPI